MVSPIELILKNTSQRIDILVTDPDGVPTDATDGPHLTVLNMGDCAVYKDAFPSYTLTGTVSVGAGLTAVTGVDTLFTSELVEGKTITIAAANHVVDEIISDTQLTLATPHVAGASGVTATKATRIIKPVGTTGQYYILWGDITAPENTPDQTESNVAKDLMFHWRASAGVGTEELNVVQGTKIVSAKTMRLANELALRIDKSFKFVDEDSSEPIYLGYTDWMLIAFLEGGLGWINGMQPYPIWSCVDAFPDVHRRILIDAAIIDALTSQELLAVDVDINYSDQGNVFTIDRQPKLSAILNTTWNRLVQTVPPMKRQYINSGAVRVEAGPDYRFQQLLSAAPSGSLFRNLFVGGQ